MAGQTFAMLVVGGILVLAAAAVLLVREGAPVPIAELTEEDEGSVVTIAGLATPEPTRVPTTFAARSGFWVRSEGGWALAEGSPIRPDLGSEGRVRGLVADVVEAPEETWVRLERSRWRSG